MIYVTFVPDLILVTFVYTHVVRRYVTVVLGRQFHSGLHVCLRYVV